MRKETETSKVRDFIWENRNKMNTSEMMNELLKISKLKKNSIRNLISEVLNPDIKGYNLPNGHHALKAQEYIKNNIDKLSKKEILNYITSNMFLSEYTANRIYLVLETEIKIEQREAAARNKKIYKGRPRNFFQFDDSKLYRGLMING